jgi:hypothetical protein
VIAGRQCDLGVLDAAEQFMTLAQFDDVEEPIDLVRLRRFPPHPAHVGQHLGVVKRVDPVPGREIMEVPGRHLHVLGLHPGAEAEHGHELRQAQHAIEIGAADMDAAA